jgi:hypothetical protein
MPVGFNALRRSRIGPAPRIVVCVENVLKGRGELIRTAEDDPQRGLSLPWLI